MESTLIQQEDRLLMPTEVWERVFGYLDGYSLGKVLSTCQLWRTVADSCEVWSQVCDGFWDNIDGSRVSITHLPLPPGLLSPVNTNTSSENGRVQTSVGGGRIGPLRRSHGRRKQLKDSFEVLHQVVYQHSYHPQQPNLVALNEDNILQTSTQSSAQTQSSITSATEASSDFFTSSVGSNASSLTTSTFSSTMSSSSSTTTHVTADGILSRASSAGALSDSAGLAQAISTLAIQPSQSIQTHQSIQPSSSINSGNYVRFADSTDSTSSVSSSHSSRPFGASFGFRELSLEDAPDEDIIRKWLPSEEEVTYILKESHQVTVDDFKQYYRLISTCLIIDPSLSTNISSDSNPMTIVTQMNLADEAELEQRLSRVNQELWTFGSPHRPLRRTRIFASVQKAIDHAKIGDFIYLRKGYYTDPISVSKPVRLCGQMSIKENIFLQAEIKSTIHWKAPTVGIEHGSHKTERRKVIRSSSSSIGPPASRNGVMDSPSSKLLNPGSSPNVVRGSISCLNFTTHNPQTHYSLIVHPGASIDIHHSLFQNRTHTGIKLNHNSSAHILRTSFSGNTSVMEVSPSCESLGLYKNVFKDKPSPDIIPLLVDQANRLFQKIEMFIVSDCRTSSEISILQQFSEVLISFIDMALIKELRNQTVVCISPTTVTQLLFVLSNYAKVRIVAQNLMFCFNNLSKLETPRHIIFMNSGLSIIDSVIEQHPDDIYVLSEACTAIWNLAAHQPSLHQSANQSPVKGSIDTLNLDQSLLTALDNFEDRPAFVVIALAALWNLSWTSDKASSKISRSGLDTLLSLQNRYISNEQVQINIFGVLWNLSTQPEIAPLISAHNGIDSILSSLKRHPSSSKLYKTCCSLLGSLFNIHGQKKRFVECGGTAVLLDALESFANSPELLVSLDNILSFLVDTEDISADVNSNHGLTAIIKALFRYYEQTRLAHSRHSLLHNQQATPNLQISSQSRNKSMIELTFLAKAMRSTSDVKYVLSVIKVMCGMQTSSSKTWESDSNEFNGFYSSSSMNELTNLIKDSGEASILLFAASSLRILVSRETSRNLSIQSGCFDIINFLTNYVHKSSKKLTTQSIAETPPDSSESTNTSQALSPILSPSPNSQIRRGSWKQTPRRPSTGSPLAVPELGPQTTESIIVDMIKMLLDFFCFLCDRYEAEYQQGRLYSVQYSDFYAAMKHFATTLKSISCPAYLEGWAQNRFNSLADPAHFISHPLKRSQEILVLLNIQGHERGQLPSSLVTPPPHAGIYLDMMSKTTGVIIKSDYRSIYNPHGRLESVRANQFVAKGSFYYEVEILSLDGGCGSLGQQAYCPSQASLLATTSALLNLPNPGRVNSGLRNSSSAASPGIQVGWATSRGLLTSKQGVGNNSYSWGCDPFKSLKWHSTNPMLHSTPESMAKLTSEDTIILWKSGDVIQCYLDLDEQEMSFGLNDRLVGVAFTSVLRDFDLERDLGFAPAITLYQGCEVRLRFSDFRYSPALFSTANITRKAEM